MLILCISMTVVCILRGYQTHHKHNTKLVWKPSFQVTWYHKLTGCSTPPAMARSTVESPNLFAELGADKQLTDSEGLVPSTGVYTTRYCCTGPGAGSQRTSRLFGVGLYTCTFLASPLTTAEGRRAHALWVCLYVSSFCYHFSRTYTLW